MAGSGSIPLCGSCRLASRRDSRVYSPETRNCPYGGGQVVFTYNSACPHYDPRTPSRRSNAPKKVEHQKGESSMLNTIQVGQLHRISSTRVYNSDKEGVTQTLSFVVNAPTETADAVLALAEQGAPVILQVGTLQDRMPLKAEPTQPPLPPTDPEAKPRSRRKAAPTPDTTGSGQDVRPQGKASPLVEPGENIHVAVGGQHERIPPNPAGKPEEKIPA